MTQAISFVVHLPAKQEHREELETGLMQVLQTMSAEPDFVEARLHRSQDDPDTFVVYETWRCTREHFIEHHLKLPYRREYETRLPRLLKRQRTVEFLEPLRNFGALPQ